MWMKRHGSTGLSSLSSFTTLPVAYAHCPVTVLDEDCMATLFIIAQNLREPKCLPTAQWMKILQCEKIFIYKITTEEGEWTIGRHNMDQSHKITLSKIRQKYTLCDTTDMNLNNRHNYSVVWKNQNNTYHFGIVAEKEHKKGLLECWQYFLYWSGWWFQEYM